MKFALFSILSVALVASASALDKEEELFPMERRVETVTEPPERFFECGEALGCTTFTYELADDQTICDGSCTWKICMVINTDLGDCFKDGDDLSHVCEPKDPNEGICYDGVPFDNTLYEEVEDVASATHCVHVSNGSTAELLIKDQAQCGEAQGFDIPHATDGPVIGGLCTGSTVSCSGAGNQDTACVFQVTGPDCPTTITTEATTTEATTTEATTTEATTTEATTTTPDEHGNIGGDPHIGRWGQPKESFHGECDLVMIHSESFKNGLGFDLHARTTIDSFYSYMESAALRVGDFTLEMEKGRFYLNGVEMSYKKDLPLSFDEFTLSNPIKTPKKQIYVLDMDGMTVDFKFYTHMLSVNVRGHPHLDGAMGLLGEYPGGRMVSRDGREMQVFEELAFEWQVHPTDVKLFHDDRAPQLPYERCRMPSEARPSRRLLRANNELYEQAEEACAATKSDDNDIQLCIGDVMATGDVGMADAW